MDTSAYDEVAWFFDLHADVHKNRQYVRAEPKLAYKMSEPPPLSRGGKAWVLRTSSSSSSLNLC